MTASTGRPAPPCSATVTDGSMMTVSPAPWTNRLFPEGYAPFASVVRTVTWSVSLREISPQAFVMTEQASYGLRMGINHIALAVKDMEATHRFYTEAMGFTLEKVEIANMRNGKARHAFYSTGSPDDQMIAFWDLRDVPGVDDYETDISRGLGLDPFVNHLAFQADSLDDLASKKQRWLDEGIDVIEIDHNWVQSIYAEDPDGNVVRGNTVEITVS